MPDFDLEAALDRAERNPDKTPARVLREAEHLFAERGFDGVKIRDVSGAAGINVSTLHFHWKDKQTLYEAVCRLHARFLRRAFERVSRDLPAQELGSGDKIDRWLDHAVELLCEHPAIAPLALQSVSNQAPPGLPDLFQHDISLFRFIENEAGKLMMSAAPGSRASDRDTGAGDPMLAILNVFYFLIVAFSDSTLQRALLGGSLRESEAQQARLKSFTRRLLRQLLGAGR
jgi:AcrR family transcriptional regulator